MGENQLSAAVEQAAEIANAEEKASRGSCNRNHGPHRSHRLTSCLAVKLDPAQFEHEVPTALGAAHTAEVHVPPLQLQVQQAEDGLKEKPWEQ